MALPAISSTPSSLKDASGWEAADGELGRAVVNFGGSSMIEGGTPSGHIALTLAKLTLIAVQQA